MHICTHEDARHHLPQVHEDFHLHMREESCRVPKDELNALVFTKKCLRAWGGPRGCDWAWGKLHDVLAYMRLLVILVSINRMSFIASFLPVFIYFACQNCFWLGRVVQWCHSHQYSEELLCWVQIPSRACCSFFCLYGLAAFQWHNLSCCLGSWNTYSSHSWGLLCGSSFNTRNMKETLLLLWTTPWTLPETKTVCLVKGMKVGGGHWFDLKLIKSRHHMTLVGHMTLRVTKDHVRFKLKKKNSLLVTGLF